MNERSYRLAVVLILATLLAVITGALLGIATNLNDITDALREAR